MLISDEEFNQMVDQAWEEIPVNFRDQIENVLIAIEDYPTRSQLHRMKIKGTLLGLYDGVPKTGWGQSMMGVQPSKITLFKGPILHSCRTVEQLKKVIKDVLLHEIGHYFGYDEKGIRDLEKKARMKKNQ